MVKKLTLIIVVLVLSEILILYTGRIGYLNATQNGTTISFADFLSKGHVYLFFIPLILGPVGLIIRQKVGWISTAMFFYSMVVTEVTIAVYVTKSLKEMTPFLVLMIVMITPIIFINTSDIKDFFKIEPTDKLVKENFISVGLMILIGVLYFSLNYF